MRRLFLPWCSLLLLSLSVPLSGSRCNRDGTPKVYPTPPAGVLIDTPTGTRTETAKHAVSLSQAAGAAIGRFVPAAFRPFPLRVRVVSPSELFAVRARDRFDPRPGGISGITGYACFTGHDPLDIDGPDTLYLSDKLSETEAAKIAIHECGHFAWWSILTDEQRAAWLPVWQSAKDRNALPSAYARTSQYEGFAELFRHACLGEPLDAELRAFFDRVRAEVSAR